jgi:hypothetical protein
MKVKSKNEAARLDAPARNTEGELERLLGQGEAGVEDTIRAYEEIERMYLASTQASEPLRFVSGYSTTTLSS